MARPGYNDDDSLNTSVYSPPPRATGNNPGGRDEGNQQSQNQTANELDEMINYHPGSTNEAVVPTSTPDMQTGFGSWFGANSGSTGSSQLVQDTIQNAIDKATSAYTEGQVKDADGRTIGLTADIKNNLIQDIMDNFYPSLPSMGLEEFLNTAGIDVNNPNEMNSDAAKEALLDFDISSMYTGYNGGTGNLMGIPEGQTGIDKLNFANPSRGGGGGGGGGYGYGSGYGNGSGYISKPEINSYNPDFAQWGRSSVQGDFIRNQKANRGGIISLMR